MKIHLAQVCCAISLCASGQSNSVNDFNTGRKLFETYCSTCHGVHKEIIGPMLASVTRKLPEEWLLSFIRNSQNIIESGDPYAEFIFRQYNHAVMPAFENLSEKEVRDILFYIERESLHPRNPADAVPRVDPQYSTAEVLAGKAVFDYQCASCHSVTTEQFGPALGSVSKRRPTQWLMDFIRNSQEVIQSGDPYAVHLYNQFDKRVMVPMEFLTDADIHSVLGYIESVSSSRPEIAGVNGKKSTTKPVPQYEPAPYDESSKKERSSTSTVFIVFVVMAAGLHGFLIIKLFLYLYKTR